MHCYTVIMKFSNKNFKRFGLDFLGYLCLLLVILVGWLPGPGGIPLLVTGLSLLSINNKWAQRLLNYVKLRSDSIRKIFFPKNATIERNWDIFSVVLLGFAFYLSMNTSELPLKVIATTLGVGSTTIFFFNRSRLEAIQNKFKKT